MSYTQLSGLSKILNPEQVQNVEKALISFSENSIITASKLADLSSIDIKIAAEFLKKLADENILIFHLGIRCPECGLLLSTISSCLDVDCEIFCYSCDEIIPITSDDIEVFYTFKDIPFIKGQQSANVNELMKPVVPYEDSLTLLFEKKILDFNSLFFAPTDQEYENLRGKYHEIFADNKTKKSKGETLEDLIITMFNLCSHYRAASIRLHPNQIDCYVRNRLYIPGISTSKIADSFLIECKNERTTPKAGYLNKLHSILKLSGKQFGIIVSICKAPRTFDSLSHQVFLQDNIIIIALDRNDIKNIIFRQYNLLECLERKIDSVKLYATEDLRNQGLYDA